MRQNRSSGFYEIVQFKSACTATETSKKNYFSLEARLDMILSKNKGTDQTAQMHRLVCALVVRKPSKTGFLASRPIWWCYTPQFLSESSSISLMCVFECAGSSDCTLISYMIDIKITKLAQMNCLNKLFKQFIWVKTFEIVFEIYQ